METATITARYVNPPKGRGPASIKDPEGNFWKFWTSGKSAIPLETFSEGGTYTVAYKVEHDEKFGDQRMILSVASDQSPPVAPKLNGQSNGHTAANGNGKYQPTDTATAERIFVCGAINAAVSAGKLDVFTPDEVIHAVESLRAAYQATFGR